MIPEFDDNGNLPPVGLIRPTIQEFEARFVIGAQVKDIRREIFNGYKKYCDQVRSFAVASTQWVDGSYTTEKPDPKDIDLVIHFDGMKLNQDEDLQKHCEKLIDKNEMKLVYKCHPQFVLVYPKDEPDLYSYYIQRYNYWLKWFSRDRDGNIKGLIEFNLQKDDFKSDVLEDLEGTHASRV